MTGDGEDLYALTLAELEGGDELEEEEDGLALVECREAEGIVPGRRQVRPRRQRSQLCVRQNAHLETRMVIVKVTVMRVEQAMRETC